jgi:hypothetical protein
LGNENEKKIEGRAKRRRKRGEPIVHGARKESEGIGNEHARVMMRDVWKVVSI